MKNFKKTHLKIILIILLPIAIIINFIASKNPEFVEKYYSLCLDKYIVKLLSSITGIIPFSLYELTMYIIAISIIAWIITFIYKLTKGKQIFSHFIKHSIINILCIASTVYFFFIVLWGINYNRVPLETSLLQNLQFKNGKDTKDNKDNKDLISLYNFLVEKSNETRKLTKQDNKSIMKNNSDYRGVINRANLGYQNIVGIIPGFEGNYSKAKPVISSKLMCYTGITGIYFPFTAEANVNIAVPDFSLPATVSHEMAHQSGFASEGEANFIAYLTSVNHPDNDFKYSGYTLALMYTGSALRKVDYEEYIRISSKLSEDVKRDLNYNSEFWSKYEGKIDEISNEFNNTYLKSNGIKSGVQNYGQMVDLLLLYFNSVDFNK
jgi:hypothetical protein